MSANNNVSMAIARAAAAINVRQVPRQKRVQSRNHNKRLRANQILTPLTPTYRPPLLTTHYIPPHHVGPPLVRRVFPRPYDCVRKTRLRNLVSMSETYDIPNTLPDKFAVFAPDNYKLRQFKVMKGDRVMISLLHNKESGFPYRVDDRVVFDNILLVGSRDHTLIGRPLIPGAAVTAVVDEITQIVKKTWIWKRKRNRKQIVRGNREWVTILRITDVDCDFIKYLTKEQLNTLHKDIEKWSDKDYIDISTLTELESTNDSNVAPNAQTKRKKIHKNENLESNINKNDTSNDNLTDIAASAATAAATGIDDGIDLDEMDTIHEIDSNELDNTIDTDEDSEMDNDDGDEDGDEDDATSDDYVSDEDTNENNEEYHDDDDGDDDNSDVGSSDDETERK